MGRFNWGPDGPPEDAYSRVTEPERFAPLHDLARMILERLERRYAVDRTEHAELFTGAESLTLVRPTVTLAPEREDAAPIEVGFTSFPGLVVRFGRQYRAYFPTCGCDACDSTFEEEAERLEWHVAQVVSGRFTEGPGSGAEFWDEVGSRTASGDTRRARGQAQHWMPWPGR